MGFDWPDSTAPFVNVVASDLLPIDFDTAVVEVPVDGCW